MKDITVKEIARVIEPEAWREAEGDEALGKTPAFETNLKCVRSLTIANRVVDYLRKVVKI